MNGLTKYDAARHALQIASNVDEVKDIRDKAEAMAAYARQAKDTELVEWATEIKVRAERRAGQMLAEMPKQDGGHAKKITRSHDSTEFPKTLAEIGISKNESSRWQKLAAVPDDQFEQAVAAAKDVAGEVTTAAMLRIEKASRPATPDKQADPAEAPHTPSAPQQQHGEDMAMHIERLEDSRDAFRDENDSLRNQLAAMLFTGDEEERAELLDRLNLLVAENKRLKILNHGLVVARDRVMTENASLRKQGKFSAKKLKGGC